MCYVYLCKYFLILAEFSDGEETELNIKKYAAIVQGLATVKCLQSLWQQNDNNGPVQDAPNIDGVVEDYLHDFVHTSYSPKTQEEFKVRLYTFIYIWNSKICLLKTYILTQEPKKLP